MNIYKDYTCYYCHSDGCRLHPPHTQGDFAAFCVESLRWSTETKNLRFVVNIASTFLTTDDGRRYLNFPVLTKDNDPDLEYKGDLREGMRNFYRVEASKWKKMSAAGGHYFRIGYFGDLLAEIAKSE